MFRILQVFALSLWGGIIRPYSNNHLPDRFLLGGGTTLRGFGMWGVGPREQGELDYIMVMTHKGHSFKFLPSIFVWDHDIGMM